MKKPVTVDLIAAHSDTRAHQLIRYNELVGLMHDEAFQQELHQALDHHFEVLVLANMSAGKSTLLNAMIGHDLLPSQNMACTAVVYRLVDCDDVRDFRCRAVLGEEITEWQPASRDLLAQWNDATLCSLVEIHGDMPFVKNKGAQLVLYDTPGPNNACDDRHARVMRHFTLTQEYRLVLYVMNATQLAVTDDDTLLRWLCRLQQESNNRQQTIFVLNKVDELDEEKGETLADVVRTTRQYLQGIGFMRPMIIPTMARAAKLFRMAARGAPLSQRERLDVRGILKMILERPRTLLDATSLAPPLRRRIDAGLQGQGQSRLHAPQEKVARINIGAPPLTRAQLERAVYATGIPTIEAILEEMLFRKALPETMKRVSTLLKKRGATQLFQWMDAQ